MLGYHFIEANEETPHPARPKTGLVFRLAVLLTWVLLLLPLHPLLAYTSPTGSILGRYSIKYASGLLFYLAILLLWLFLLVLPRPYVDRVSRIFGHLKSDSRWHIQFIATCVFLALLVLTVMRQWGWGYNPLLWLDILILGLWLSLLPTFWDWGLRGWPMRGLFPGRVYDWFTDNPHYWLPPLIGAGVLVMSNVLGFGASTRQLMLFLGLVPGIAAVLAFLHWPALGLIALVITSLVVPSPSLPGGLNAAVLLLILLIGLQLMAVIGKKRPLHLAPSRTAWPALAIILSVVISFGVGQLPWYTFAPHAPIDAQIGGLAMFVLAVGAFLLIAHQIHDLRWLQWLSWIFIILAFLHVAGWLVPGVSGFTSRLLQNGTHNHSLFWVWLVALTLSQAVFNQTLKLRWRLALGGMAMATLYVGFVLNNDWKSGYLPPLAAIGAIIAVRSWRTGLVMALAAAPVALYLSSEAIATDDYSYSTRVDALLIMVEIIKANPIFGLGPANYYWYTPLFPIRGWAVQFNSHNNYVDIVAQTGLLGLACFLWFAWEVGWLGWRLRERVPVGFARAYVYGAIGGLAGTMVAAALADWVIPFTYNIGLTGFRMTMLGWIFLGGLVSLEQMYGRPTSLQKGVAR